MAKKAAKKTGKKSGKRKTSGKGIWDMEEIAGIGAGVYASPMIDGAIPANLNLDPKVIGAGKFYLGRMLEKGKFGGGGSFMRGAGMSLQVTGAQDLMRAFGLIQGDEDDLVVSIDGIDDNDPDSIEGDDDIDTINEDVLGEDDIDTVNEDVLGEDDEEF